mmetsp:Transcript_106304/g.300626  ORF Transcript_106304/g.300626 Transcript_106304/m.300626 type:complete len:232 (-) Transcript_106304:110-805(-)
MAAPNQDALAALVGALGGAAPGGAGGRPSTAEAVKNLQSAIAVIQQAAAAQQAAPAPQATPFTLGSTGSKGYQGPSYDNGGGDGYGKGEGYGKDGGKGKGKQWIPYFLDDKGKGKDGKDGKGKFGKDGKGKYGKDFKGKGKARGPSGPSLPRTRITQAPVTGEVVEWRGKYGWIKPTIPIENPAAKPGHKGNIYVSMSDLVGVESLTLGNLCQFHVFQDPSGLGAEEVIGS